MPPQSSQQVVISKIGYWRGPASFSTFPAPLLLLLVL